jgi:glycosylphosphatidylinositol transamidase (GPIT) subunit GPI8
MRKLLERKVKSEKYTAALLFLLVIILTSCKQGDHVTVIVPARHWVEKTVAVVAPIGDANTRKRLERTAQWFQENLETAQKYDTLAVRLKLEWYDEQSDDLASLSNTITNRNDIVAVIGPFDNDAANTFAAACQKTLKPLILPTATSEDIIRRYAVRNSSGITNNKPFLWALTETDVKLTEILMSSYATYCQFKNDELTRNSYLLAPANSYGQTFTYWAPFFAENFGIDLIDNQQYTSQSELHQFMKSYIANNTEEAGISLLSGFFTVLQNVEQFYDIALYRRKLIFDMIFAPINPTTPFDSPEMDEYWQFFEGMYQTAFAINNICEEDIEACGNRAFNILQGYQGFSPYADPTTGFVLSYETRFSVKPTFAECKFYDALLLTAFAACYAEHYPTAEADSSLLDLHSSLNDAIITITSAKENTLSGAAWNATTMEVYLSMMERGNLLHFKGASGDIAFDPETFTSATHTTYLEWRILDGKIQHVAYLGTGSSRIGSSYAAWQYLYDKNTAEQDFDQQAGTTAPINYPALTNQYAVLVQGSEGFKNYRHQSDVLSVYQLLRRGGFDDDHIILIIDKALANSSDNPEKGIIRAAMDAPDLLGGTDNLPAAVIDYDAATLTPADINNILLGEQSGRLSTVLPKDAGQNVFFYWSGHGRSGEFSWRNSPNGQGFTGEMMRQMATEMLNGAHCRKLFVVAEPCYSESVVRPLEGIQGVLAMTGASGSEQSWADNWSTTALVWMSDRFSQNFVEHLTENLSSNYRDLFLYCAKHTLGSHAKIVNASHFGNLYNNGPQEFIVKKKQ